MSRPPQQPTPTDGRGARAIAIIPARYDSVRFPGKMLADRTGKPLVQHVHEQVSRAAQVDQVIVATDDERIANAVRRFGANAVMTRRDHPNGTSRIAEVAATLGSELIVNVQGDEPEIQPELIDRAIDSLARADDCVVSTVAAPMPLREAADPNIVKVVIDRRGRALFFSRSLIPFDRDGDVDDMARPLRHVGLYVYRREFLARYAELEPTPLERTEKLEQLRVLEHGFRIAVHVETDARVAGELAPGIDTREQYEAFVRRLNASIDAKNR